MADEQKPEFVAVQHPTEGWARAIKVRRSGSDAPMSEDERLIMALHAALSRLQAAGGQGVAPTVEAAHAMGAKGGPVVEAERLAFEAWMKGHCWSLSATWDGKTYRGSAESTEYVCPRAMNTRQLWAAWRDRAALAHPPAAPALVPLSEQDAALLNQAHEILLEHAEDQRSKGNDSTAMGAECSAEAVLRLGASAARNGLTVGGDGGGHGV
jgi:hypothetical protein